MKSLADHDAEQRALIAELNNPAPRRNGIACPQCGAELFDSSPMFVMTSNPPKKAVHCSSCDYSGSRVA